LNVILCAAGIVDATKKISKTYFKWYLCIENEPSSIPLLLLYRMLRTSCFYQAYQ